MTQQVIGDTRRAQRTAGSVINANFDELYDREIVIEKNAAAAAGSFSVPAGYYIEDIIIVNNTANAVTGGIKFGKTVGATDIVAAQTVAASSINFIAHASILIRLFAKSGAAQTVYFDAVTGWNSATVDIRVVLRKAF